MDDPVASPGRRWRIRHFDDIDSTNRYALDAARGGETEGLVVVADHQSAGRGRRGRAWTAPPGSSLLCSVLLSPTLEPDRLHLLTLAAALALVDAVKAVADVHADLKWPNDLVVGERKLAGVLAEADLSGDAPRRVVVGVGCNVAADALPPELATIATSCEAEAGRPVARAGLLEAFLEHLDGRLDAIDQVSASYRERLATLGRSVRVELTSDSIEGVATDVDDLGRLVVQPAAGPSVIVAAGDVVHLRAVTDRGSTPPTRRRPRPVER